MPCRRVFGVEKRGQAARAYVRRNGGTKRGRGRFVRGVDAWGQHLPEDMQILHYLAHARAFNWLIALRYVAFVDKGLNEHDA